MNRPPDNRKALGRGLSSLLPTKATENATTPASTGPFALLPPDQIKPNPTQPRQLFQPDALAELAESIKANGIIQPLIVRPKDGTYELVAGERRWRAAKLAGLTQVPVVIQEVAEDKVLELALIENIQRADLNPIETAQAFQRLVRELNVSHEEIGRRTGKDRTTITNFIRLLKLPVDLQQMVAEGKLTTGHARALLALGDEQQQRDIALKCIALNLSVRSLEKMIQNLTAERAGKEQKEPPKLDPNIRAAIEEMERVLGTRVRIVATGNDRGHIEIEYYSQDDLDRVYLQIIGDAN
ncbi:MAG: ParB/RepB/Spo0J family partition protein [Bryobacteraceae bacterium]|nr:ParB/RepB/Spo0J family partition protein [Bryobacteraceae bacterium]